MTATSDHRRVDPAGGGSGPVPASRPARGFRLLHTADLHLAAGRSAPGDGDHIEHCLCALVVLADAADRHRADAVLITGDLFDHARLPAWLVAEVFDRLSALPVPCVLIPGNHDVHDDTSPYRRHAEIVAASTVHFVDDHDGAHVELFDGALVVWGRAMAEHTPGNRPLRDIPARPNGGAWFVVAGHGHHVGDEEPGPLSRSSPITNADIASTGADYVALGHWHVPTDISVGEVVAWYAGAPFDLGRSGGLLVVDLHPDRGVDVIHVPVETPPGGCGPARL